MLIMSRISKYYFDRAQYVVGDDFGNEVMLVIDYRNNKFQTKVVKQQDDRINNLKRDISPVAKDLLARKHGINFAKKFA